MGRPRVQYTMRWLMGAIAILAIALAFPTVAPWGLLIASLLWGSKNPKQFYRFAVPAIWLVAALASWDHPGDEYGLFIVSCLPAAWIAPFLEFTHLREVLPILLAAGLATTALVGWLMDGLRVRRAIWLPLFVFGAIALVLHALSRYPSYQRAIMKNGSLTAYVSAATNLSLYISATLTVAAASLGRVVSLVRRGLGIRDDGEGVGEAEAESSRGRSFGAAASTPDLPPRRPRPTSGGSDREL